MITYSRRLLAKYAVEQMLANRPRVELSRYLAAALTASGRQKEVDLLLSDIEEQLEEDGFLVQARVTSARPLTATLKDELAKQLKKMTRANKVVLSEQLDESVIAGIKVETASRSWDRTLEAMLKKLRENN